MPKIPRNTNLTPLQCVLGFQPPLFPWNLNNTWAPSVDDWFNKHEQVWETAHQQLERVTEIRKQFAD